MNRFHLKEHCNLQHLFPFLEDYMSQQSKNLSAQRANISGIFVSSTVIVDALPKVWKDISEGHTHVPNSLVGLYLDAAWEFYKLDKSNSEQALQALGESFLPKNYPNLKRLYADTHLKERVKCILLQIHDEFGAALPSDFYKLLWNVVDKPNKHGYYRLFEGDATQEDLIADAALHGLLLVTPLAKRLHSIYASTGATFDHVMDCGCISALSKFSHENPNYIPKELRSAYLQNMVRATLEQYGTNARTSK